MSAIESRTWAEQMSTGLARIDDDLRLQWINPALAECLELGLRSAVGLPLATLFADPDALAQVNKVVVDQRITQ